MPRSTVMLGHSLREKWGMLEERTRRAAAWGAWWLMRVPGRNHVHSATATLLLMLGVIVGCVEPPQPIVSRLVPAASSHAIVSQLTADGRTRNGVTLAVRNGVGRTAFAAGPLAPGTIRVEVAAPRGVEAGESKLRISLRGADWRSKLFGLDVPVCVIDRAGESAASAWRHCDLDVPRPLGGALVEIEVDASGDGDLYIAQPIYTPRALGAQPDVYVLLIDTVRADKLRPFATRLPIGERFVELARDAITFSKLRSSSSWTRTAVATLFTGLRADRHQVYGRLDLLRDGIPSLPAMLQQHGYVTAAWSANPNVLPMWGFARGFDAFSDVGAEKWAGNKTDGEDLFAAVRADLEAAPRAPGFFYIHLMDAHAPYLPPRADRKTVDAIPDLAQTFPRPLAIFGDPDAWDRYRNYLGELIDLDRAVGRFTKWLKETDRYDNSLILVVSDHGEEFLDHGGRDHGRTLYEEMLRVPAMLKLPGSRDAASTIDDAVTFEDMLPTLLTAIGAPVPTQIDGCNALESPCRDLPHFAELRLDGNTLASAIVDPWKVIVDQTSKRRELYDLAADPLERNNLTFANPVKLAEMEQLLAAMLSRAAHGWHLRACGGDDTVELSFSLHGAVATVSEDALEAEDAVTVAGEGDGNVAVSFVLRPYDATREFFGRLVTQRRRDEDEIRVEAESATSPLRLESESEIRFVVGASKVVGSAHTLDLAALRADAVVPGTSVVTCPLAPPAPAAPADATLAKNVPLLRLWYVEPPAALSAASVDPAIADRLRALGYLW